MDITGANTYTVLTFDMTVAGDFEKVEDFILALDRTPTLRTLVIEELDVRGTDRDASTALISFSVYAMGG